MANIVCYNTDGGILDHYIQWDTDQKLIIKGADLSVEPIIYFSNIAHQRAFPVESDIVDNGIVVDVPDILLQDAYPLIVYVDYMIGATPNFTIRIPVMPMKKPTDYIYEDDDYPSSTHIAIANNLTTNSAEAALSAAQGVVLKEMIDNFEVDIDVSDQINDALESAKNSGEFDGRGIVSILRTGGTGEAGTVDTYTITYSDNTTSTFSVYNGSNGLDGTDGDSGSGESGENGATFTPIVDSAGNLSWINDKGLANPEPVNIKGQDGVSPVVTTQEVSTGIEISVVNGDGTTSSATVLHGKDGTDGGDGSDALINGVNTLTINTGEGLTSVQSGSVLTISANYQYGAEDLSAGSSPLETGMLYFVYE